MNLQIQSRPYTSWQLIKAYFRSEQKVFAYAFLMSVLFMTIFLVGVDVVLNNWYNYFYNALQEYDKGGVYDLIGIFLFIAGVYIIFAVYRYYMQSYLGLRWRRWLTEQFLERWLSNRSYYYLENFDKTTDNPDQRIQDDIGSLVVGALSLLIGLVESVTTIFAFIYILWKLSGILTISLGSWGVVKIPGYLAWIGVIYAIVGTYLTFKIGRPLIKLNFQQQRKEADFRFGAVDVRMHSENIALYRGEHHQGKVLNRLFNKVLDNWYAIILRQKMVLWFTAGYNQLSVILPLAVALPNYFNKVFKLGGLIQAIKAFGTVQSSLSFLINAYPQIAEWRAVCRRLITFLNHMYEVEQRVLAYDHLAFTKQPVNKIAVTAMNLSTPTGTSLLQNFSYEFNSGLHYLIQGASGIGKSTFVRAIAGIWPYGSGQIQVPDKKHIMFLPQKLYMPLGTLKEALLFPDHLTVSDEEMKTLLFKCGLSDFQNRLHETAMWTQQLSPGEQQRMAFVRVLLQKPDWVLLDESTSALDLENERKMYALLKAELPNCSIISVGHRDSLIEYHDQIINFGMKDS